MVTNNQLIGGVIIAVAVGFVLASGGIAGFSLGGDQADGEIPGDIVGEDANVDAKAVDAADSSSPSVAVPVDLYDSEGEFINSATTNSDGSRQSVSGLTVGESYAAFYGVDNSTYYADRDPGTGSELIDAKTVRSNGQVHSILAGGDASVSIYDSDNSDVSAGSVTVGSGETYTFEKIRARANAEDVSWNAEYVYINDSELSGVDEWRLDGASEIDVPDKLDSTVYSHAFQLGQAGDLTAGEAPTLGAFEKIEPGQLSLDMESGQNPAGDVDVCVDDAATFKNDADQVEQGAEDQDGNDVGLSSQCVTVTVS